MLSIAMSVVLGAGVCSVQRGAVSLPVDLVNDGGFPQRIEVPLLPVDDARTVIWFAHRGASGIPGQLAVGLRTIVDGGMLVALTVDRTQPTIDVLAVWQAATFCSGVRAQRGEDLDVSPSSLALHAPMAVDRSLGSTTNASGGSGYGANDFYLVRPFSDAQLEVFDWDSTDLGNAINWQVFEDDGMHVDRDVKQLMPGMFFAEHAAQGTVDPSRSFARVTWRMTGPGGASGSSCPTAQLLTDGGIRVERLLETNDTVEYVWEVVSFDDGTRVFTGRESLTALQTVASVVLPSAVDLGRSVAFTAAGDQGGAFASPGPDLGAGLFTARLAGPARLELERATQSTGSISVVDWVVLEFPDGGVATSDAGTQCINSLPLPDGGCVVPKLDPHQVRCGCEGSQGTGLALALAVLLRGRRGPDASRPPSARARGRRAPRG